MKKVINRVNELLKSESTKLIESICNDGTIMFGDFYPMIDHKRKSTERYEFENTRMTVHSFDLSHRIDFDCSIDIDVIYGYRGKKYKEGFYTFRINVDFQSRIRITTHENQVTEVKVNAATRKAIENSLESIINIK